MKTKKLPSTTGTIKETKKKKSIDTYNAKCGCWNCDAVYEIPIEKGINTPEFLLNVDPLCKNCGCGTLKMYHEYTVEKKIMKDLILHHRIEHMSDGQQKQHKPSHEHYK